MAESNDLSLEEHLSNIFQTPVIRERGMRIESVKYLSEKNGILPYSYDKNARQLIVAVSTERDSSMQLNDLLIEIPEFPQLITEEMRQDGISEKNIAITYINQDMMDKLKEYILHPDKVKQYFQNKQQRVNSEEGLYDSDSAANQIIDSIIVYAIKNRASDIHFEAEGTRYRARVRIDGELKEYPIRIDDDKYPAVISSIKVRSKMDIAEKRKPQDGSLSAKQGILKEGKISNYDLRASVTPTVHESENAVLRIAERGAYKTLEEMGFSVDIYKKIKKICLEPYGLILVTGPTGSGKTTTLYGMINELNTVDRKIITIEDPVEIKMNGVEQLQIKESIGLDFAKYIRTVLRRDPDTILIGEIRDNETAKAAIDASKTGHLVLSTLHTNNATSTLLRLMAMGIAHADLASNIQAILAQRLIGTYSERIRNDLEFRKNPKNIKNIDGGLELNELMEEDYFKPSTIIFKSDNDTNEVYSGQTILTELWTINREARDMISAGIMQEEKYFTAAINNGMKPMVMSGLELILNNTTSLKKIINTIGITAFKENKDLIKRRLSNVNI